MVQEVKMGFTCNITKKDRWTRVIFGGIFLPGALLSWSKTFFIALAAIMIIEGFIGWCGIAAFMDRFKIK